MTKVKLFFWASDAHPVDLKGLKDFKIRISINMSVGNNWRSISHRVRKEWKGIPDQRAL